MIFDSISGNKQIVELLIENEADIEIKDSGPVRRTALQWALDEGEWQNII